MSILLKTIPWSASVGNNVILTAFPLCIPIPEKDIGLEIVVCFSTNLSKCNLFRKFIIKPDIIYFIISLSTNHI